MLVFGGMPGEMTLLDVGSAKGKCRCTCRANSIWPKKEDQTGRTAGGEIALGSRHLSTLGLSANGGENFSRVPPHVQQIDAGLEKRNPGGANAVRVFFEAISQRGLLGATSVSRGGF